ncbi:hypothetical protein Cycma_4861 [Cyclobacterium marinum DSM 745]|uniref:Uncharacterized protein n=1 Tax=Cyclobacterium marinum (strain ATCC 25205 / DSM 745 / LMG 13164 / NCIMB 1802) TaxID=880070 RepID=G0J6N1_CYCMS|nr:hypothetical protein Cycma_4861 [Cyclobacterium marinum DSM 745]
MLLPRNQSINNTLTTKKPTLSETKFIDIVLNPTRIGYYRS